MSIRWIITVCAALFAMMQRCDAQVDQDPFDDPSISIYASYLGPRGVGFDTGYATGGFFYVTEPASSYVRPLLLGQFHVLDNGKAASNVGVGARFINPSSNGVYGFLVAYDWRLAHMSYNQVGLSLERLSCTLDVRFNGYLPVGVKAYMSHKHYYRTPYGNFVQILQTRQKAAAGFDAEVGRCFVKPWDGEIVSLYGAIGPYYFTQDRRGNCCCEQHPIAGGKARLALSLYNLATFEVRGSYDPVFHGIVAGQVTVRFPLGSQTRAPCTRPCWLETVAAQPIVRDDLIVLDPARCLWEANF